MTRTDRSIQAFLPPVASGSTREGTVLGVDVGYSELRPSLGYCVMRIEAGSLRIVEGALGLDTLDRFVAVTLPRLIHEHSPRMIAADGPMATDRAWAQRPMLNRPHERLLMRGAMPACIKAQPWLAPVGRQLTNATTRILRAAEAEGFAYAPLTPGEGPPRDRCVVESFPKVWLGLLLPADWTTHAFAMAKVARSHRDWWMARRLIVPAPEQRKDRSIRPLAQRFRAGGLTLRNGLWADAMGQKDLAAATVSALSAALAVLGWGGAIGSEIHGSFLVPASFLWGRGWDGVLARAAEGFREDAAGPVIIRRRLA